MGTAYDNCATRVMGEAFDSARKELHDTGQPDIVYEVIAKRIIDEAKKGERDPSEKRRTTGLGLCKGGVCKKSLPVEPAGMTQRR